MNRRHDIDALRALAFGLLILFHTGMVYVADWGFHIKSAYTSEFLQLPMLFMGRWRMSLVFLISGISLALMMRSGASSGLLMRLRTKRILWPLIFGMVVVIPIQPYCEGVMRGLVEPGFAQFLGHYYFGYDWPVDAFTGKTVGSHRFTWNHLWYLVYLLAYTLFLIALLPLLQSPWGRKCRDMFNGLSGWRLIIYPAVPLLMIMAALIRKFPVEGDLIHDWFRNPIYFTEFLYGWWIGTNEAIWRELARLRWYTLLITFVAFAGYIYFDNIISENELSWTLFGIWPLRTLYTWCALCTILGWGHRLLNRPFRWLPWATESVFPWYMLHQSVIILMAYWLIPLKLGAFAEPLLVLTGTALGCWLLTTFVIAKVNWLRPCFGMKAVHNSGNEVNIPRAPLSVNTRATAEQ